MTVESVSPRWRFRSSSAEDLDRLYNIWYASVLATHNFVSPTDLDEICVQVKNSYLPNTTLLVAMDRDGQLAGFMGMSGHEIESLFIHPAFRGCGLGRAFIAEAAAHSSHLEVAVNAQNAQAAAFYGAVGFTVCGSSPTDDEGRPYPILRMKR
jgi:putative acetyltransferase